MERNTILEKYAKPLLLATALWTTGCVRPEETVQPTPTPDNIQNVRTLAGGFRADEITKRAQEQNLGIIFLSVIYDGGNDYFVRSEG